MTFERFIKPLNEHSILNNNYTAAVIQFYSTEKQNTVYEATNHT